MSLPPRNGNARPAGVATPTSSLASERDPEARLQWHSSVCPLCGLGCGLLVGLEPARIVAIRGNEGHPTNRGDCCPLAAGLPSTFTAQRRLTRPMIRREGKLVPASWDEAIGRVAEGLERIIESHGPSAIAFYGGAGSYCEESYLANKLMRGSIGTSNVECSTRLCMASTAAGFFSTLGADAPPTCYADIEEADLFFVAGFNMAVSAPVLFRRLMHARRTSGAKLVVVDPRRTPTAESADIHLRIRPGTDIALNNALAHVLLEEGFVDDDAVERTASGLDDLKELAKEFPPSRGAELTGCPEEKIREAARVIGNAESMLTFWFQGYNHSTQAVFKNNTLHNLWLLTGNFGRPGAGPVSITGEANALGNRWVGVMSHLLPGGRLVSNAQHRQEMADFWGIPVEMIHAVPGRSIMEILQGLHSGEVRALWTLAVNPAASLPHTRWVEQALARAELLVVQDVLHPTETTRLADVVLAGAQWCEKTGTVISSERRIELMEKLIDPPGEAKSDCEIIWSVARAMGLEKAFPYSSPEQIFEEWKQITRGRICDMSGVSYDRLRGKVGLQLPCRDGDDPGTPRLFLDRVFPRHDGRAALLPRDHKGPAETPDQEYPFVLMTGRTHGQFNTRTPDESAQQRDAGGFVEIQPEDAESLGIADGDPVALSSRRGSVRATARFSSRVLIGNLYMDMHHGRSPSAGSDRLVNLVSNPSWDIHSKQPEFKISAVSISRIPMDRESSSRG